ncbi:MAG: FecR family protein [Firmicutes bacterium]|nr:FecR family protein [Bacillota bacterium]
MIKRFLAIILSALILFPIMTTIPVYAAPTAPTRRVTVYNVYGRNADLYRHNVSRPTRPRTNIRISAGDSLVTGSNTEVYLNLDGASLVKVNANSTLNFELTNSLIGLNLLRGQSLVQVAEQAPEQTLEARLGNLVFTVRGTMFTMGHIIEDNVLFIVMLSGSGEIDGFPLNSGQILTSWYDENEVTISGQIVHDWRHINRNVVISEIQLDELDIFTLDEIISNQDYLLENSEFITEELLEEVEEIAEILRPEEPEEPVEPVETPAPRPTATAPPVESGESNESNEIPNYIEENAPVLPTANPSLPPVPTLPPLLVVPTTPPITTIPPPIATEQPVQTPQPTATPTAQPTQTPQPTATPTNPPPAQIFIDARNLLADFSNIGDIIVDLPNGWTFSIDPNVNLIFYPPQSNTRLARSLVEFDILLPTAWDYIKIENSEGNIIITFLTGELDDDLSDIDIENLFPPMPTANPGPFSISNSADWEHFINLPQSLIDEVPYIWLTGNFTITNPFSGHFSGTFYGNGHRIIYAPTQPVTPTGQHFGGIFASSSGII